MKKDVHPFVGFHYDSPAKGNEALAEKTAFKFSALLNECESNVCKAN